MRLAKKTQAQQVSITLVSARDAFDERVRSHQAAAGQTLPRHPLSALLRGTRIQFLLGQVLELQAAARQVVVRTTNGSQVLHYDYLIYALGSHVVTSDVPGVREHAIRGGQ
jgi:NADH dehydrogenase FAD-containing subunit